jgi:glycosyltransferase involved in cell wall biosynthesis
MERKRVIDLVRALPKIVESVQSAKLVVVGKRNANAERIEVLARELGVGERVVMVDHVPYAEVPYYFAMADVYCLPSAYEGFPFTVLEAMASGTPVVASRIPGIDEQIVHGVNGFLHPVGDTHLIAHYVSRVLEEPGLASRVSEAGRKMVSEQYDWSVIGERTEAALLRTSAAKGKANRRSFPSKMLAGFRHGA